MEKAKQKALATKNVATHVAANRPLVAAAIVVVVVAALFARRLELTGRAHNMSGQLRCALCLPQQVATSAAAPAAATGASFVLFTV